MKYVFFITVFFVQSLILYSQNKNVAINETGAYPDSSAMLDVSSTNKGVLVPRMNATEQSAVTPVLGLLIYNTDSACFAYYDGTKWTYIHGGKLYSYIEQDYKLKSIYNKEFYANMDAIINRYSFDLCYKDSAYLI